MEITRGKFVPGKKCLYPECLFQYQCMDASDLDEEIEAFKNGEHNSLEEQIGMSQCDHADAEAMRVEGTRVLKKD